jgi:hypothetical protein
VACSGIVIEKFDPPILLSADLPRGPQKDRLQHLSRLDRLHRSALSRVRVKN